MITFIDLYFSPSGTAAAALVAKLQPLKGVTSVMGEHDVMFRWKTSKEFDSQMRAIQKALVGSGAMYRVFTVEDSYQSRDPVPWIGPIDSGPAQHPAIEDSA